MLKFIDEMLEYAKKNQATDIHLTAGSVPRIRIDGNLTVTPFKKILPEDTASIINVIMNEEQKNTLKDKHYLCLPVTMDNVGRMRVNVFMQRSSYSINFKLLDRTLAPSEELGIPDAIIDLHKLKSGLVLFCGNRKSGKSTTIGTIIKKIVEKRECHVITVEDPIEYLYKHDKAIINQKEVGLDVGSLEEGVYSAISQDPDVIMVSFAGSPEIFSAVLAAAENGHLVLTSLRTSGVVKTIEYIIGMYPEDRRNHIKMQIGNVLQAIVTQQLISSIDGKGLRLAAEIMIATNAMKNLIMENKAHQIPAMIKASRSLGMITMEEAIDELYTKGLISRESAISYKQSN
jgi:twitching motility protein PilT